MPNNKVIMKYISDMATATTTPSQAEIIINVSDMSIASDIRRLLKRVSGITDIKIRKTQNEIELSLEEADKGVVTEWKSVDDFSKQCCQNEIPYRNYQTL